MSFWNQLLDTLGNAVELAKAETKARDEVRSWADFRTRRAESAIEQFVTAAVAQQNGRVLEAALDELAAQIKLADTWELQEHVSSILWVFKECVGNQLAAFQSVESSESSPKG